MGAHTSRTEFDWSYTEEPHATRRKLILKKYPELKALFGIDHSFKYVVTTMVFTMFFAFYYVRDKPWSFVLLEAYLFGGVMNHALTLAIHEISHNIAFGNHAPMKNRIFGMFANLPIGIPMSISFKKYHIEHHRYLGEKILDTDVPTELEGVLFTRTSTKALWLFLQPFFYAFRPMIVYKKAPTDLEVINLVIQLSFDYFIYATCGPKALVFMVFGSVISMGWHPMAGHFISEHYVFTPGQETYSYYGPMNMVAFNVGHHVEHHDFPYIPGDKLPLVRKIAPEYYSELTHHESWVWVLWQFVVNPALGPYARIKREPRVNEEFYGQNMLTPYWEAVLHFVGFYLIRDWIVGLEKRSNVVKSSPVGGGSPPIQPVAG